MAGLEDVWGSTQSHGSSFICLPLCFAATKGRTQHPACAPPLLAGLTPSMLTTASGWHKTLAATRWWLHATGRRGGSPEPAAGRHRSRLCRGAAQMCFSPPDAVCFSYLSPTTQHCIHFCELLQLLTTMPSSEWEARGAPPRRGAQRSAAPDWPAEGEGLLRTGSTPFILLRVSIAA